tara:strand:- start:41 stop:283 length:243 start_codon:yes stop_codon:yes gene_type:complete
MQEYLCTYRKKLPVDEFGRLGGFYSLADIPIAGYEIKERRGIILGQYEDKDKDGNTLYKIQDVEKPSLEFAIPVKDVEID